MNSGFRKLLDYFNLTGEINTHTTIRDAIERDVIFKGTNLWILIFAIVVASIGLNVNSTAVVIGAMLISPLMGPINGIGYSIATYNFPLFRKAVKNFAFAVIAGLVASTLYFAISPLRTAHSELLSRTSPTIYDVLIAAFGGLAGIVAICSKQKGNVIPGVAIATALMPPLCTAGYGLATVQFHYFFGALYLFTINSVFIAIAAMVVSQVLKFPEKRRVEEEQKTKVNRWTLVVIIVTIIPSIYFGYLLVQKERFSENASQFVNNVSLFEGNYLMKHEIDPDTKTISLTYGGSGLTEDQKDAIRSKAQDFKLTNPIIEFHQGLSFDALRQKVTESEFQTAEIHRLSSQLQRSQQILDSVQNRAVLGKQLLTEIKPLYPALKSCAYAETLVYSDSLADGTKMVQVVFGVPHDSLTVEQQQKIGEWIRARLQSDAVQVLFKE